MANRQLQQFRLSFEKAVADIFGKVAIGATGAPTLNVAQSKGIASITRTGVGAYTITLSDKWSRLLAHHASIVLASGAPGTSSNVQMVVRTDNSAAAAKTLLVEFLGNAGTAVELASGVSLLLKLTVKNSSV